MPMHSLCLFAITWSISETIWANSSSSMGAAPMSQSLWSMGYPLSCARTFALNGASCVVCSLVLDQRPPRELNGISVGASPCTTPRPLSQEETLCAPESVQSYDKPASQSHVGCESGHRGLPTDQRYAKQESIQRLCQSGHRTYGRPNRRGAARRSLLGFSHSGWRGSRSNTPTGSRGISNNPSGHGSIFAAVTSGKPGGDAGATSGGWVGAAGAVGRWGTFVVPFWHKLLSIIAFNSAICWSWALMVFISIWHLLSASFSHLSMFARCSACASILFQIEHVKLM